MSRWPCSEQYMLSSHRPLSNARFQSSRYPGKPLWAAGYSFGARTVGSLATRERRIERLVLLALPVSIYDSDFLEDVEQPTLMIFGGGDSFGTLTELARKHPWAAERFELEEVPGADHFFRGRTPRVEELVRDWARAATGRSVELADGERSPS